MSEIKASWIERLASSLCYINPSKPCGGCIQVAESFYNELAETLRVESARVASDSIYCTFLDEMGLPSPSRLSEDESDMLLRLQTDVSTDVLANVVGASQGLLASPHSPSIE